MLRSFSLLLVNRVMDSFLHLFQIFISLFLILLILLQGRSAGLSAPFGGGGGETFKTRRGLEKILFYLTIFTAFLFALTLIAAIIV